MSRQAQYTVLPLDLTTAGEEIIDGPWGVLRFLDAVDAAGDVATAALLQVKSERTGEAAPFRLGFGFFARDTRRWIVSWEAQTGVTVTLGLADRPETLDWDADPPAKLLTGSIKLKGASNLLTATDVACATGAKTSALALNADRRTAYIQNLHPANEVRVGDTNVAAGRGLRLGPGELQAFNTTAEIFVRNDSGASVTVAVSEEDA